VVGFYRGGGAVGRELLAKSPAAGLT
jgi:hypothetical protein